MTRSIPPQLRLVVASGLMLLVELALIRWLGANLIYLSYFSNFVLLGSFLGIGLGFLHSRSANDLSRFFPIALAVIVVLVIAFPIQVGRDTTGALIYIGGPLIGLKMPVIPAWVVLPLVFVAVAFVMACAGEYVARIFVTLPPLEAYRFDILGSLAGITVFSVISLVNGPSLYWGVVVTVAVLFLSGRRPSLSRTIFPLAVLLTMLGVESYALGYIWSPYYKIAIVGHPDSSCRPDPNNPLGCPVYDIFVNGIPHQGIETVQTLKAEQALVLSPFEHRVEKSGPKNVLIIGAGTGKDVAAALSFGAQHIDAVEIDPQIADAGIRLNPDHPYQDPRVSLHINDGRAFLEQTSTHYDVILFSQTDSLTLLLGQGSLRLESYLFTQQAMESAMHHLAPHGVFGAYNVYWQQWYVDRLANTLATVYGHAPCLDLNTTPGAIAAMTISPDPADVSCTTTWKAPSGVIAPAQDDSPFPYLQGATIPPLDLIALPLILAGALVAVLVANVERRSMWRYSDLFFMGAAFLLLETKSVVQFALLFGTTWFVNALVFAGVLVAVSLAIEFSRHVTIRRPALMYGVLLILLVLAWAIPLNSLLGLGFWPRFAAAVGITFAPVLVANVVFAQRFRATADSTVAFATNLLGAMVGGVLEYVALMTGYRFLLIVIALLYAAAFLAGRRHLAA